MSTTASDATRRQTLRVLSSLLQSPPHEFRLRYGGCLDDDGYTAALALVEAVAEAIGLGDGEGMARALAALRGELVRTRSDAEPVLEPPPTETPATPITRPEPSHVRTPRQEPAPHPLAWVGHAPPAAAPPRWHAPQPEQPRRGTVRMEAEWPASDALPFSGEDGEPPSSATPAPQRDAGATMCVDLDAFDRATAPLALLLDPNAELPALDDTPSS